MKQDNIMKLTTEMITNSMSDNGGYTKGQLAIIGVEWPPIQGWKESITKKDFDIDIIYNFTIYNRKHLFMG